MPLYSTDEIGGLWIHEDEIMKKTTLYNEERIIIKQWFWPVDGRVGAYQKAMHVRTDILKYRQR